MNRAISNSATKANPGVNLEISVLDVYWFFSTPTQVHAAVEEGKLKVNKREKCHLSCALTQIDKWTNSGK